MQSCFPRLTSRFCYLIVLIAVSSACKNNISQTEAVAFASRYYSGKYQHLEKDAASFAKAAANVPADAKIWSDFQSRGVEFLSAMNGIGLHVGRTKCSVKIDTVHAGGDQASFLATEELHVIYNMKKGEAPDSIESVYKSSYNVIITRKGDDFIVSKEESLSETPLFIEKAPVTGKITFDTTHRQKKEQLAKAEGFPYDRQQAANYALAHWNSPNPAFCNFADSDDSKGDCTNFASQCVNAGGWLMTDDWRSQGTGCCSNYVNCLVENCYTCSWTVAHEFFVWLGKTPRVEQASVPVNDLDIGDILQQDYDSDGHIDHSMIVTDKRDGIPFVTFRHVTTALSRVNIPSNQIRGSLFTWKLKNAY